jgi:hypothetical protein
MRLRNVLIILLVACGLLATAGVGWAASLADENLFWGTTVSGVTTASSADYPPDYISPYAINGLGGGAGWDLVFAPGNSDQRLVITGFNSSVGNIRLWTGGDLPVNAVGVWSSTTATSSIDPSEAIWSPRVDMTTLDSGATMGSWTAATGGYYRDITVNAPAGTQSLLFGFGGSRGPGNAGAGTGTGFARVEEVQAFAYKNTVNIDIDGSSGAQAAPVTYSGFGVAGGGTWNAYTVYSAAAGGNVTPPQSENLSYSNGSASSVKFALSEANPDNQASHSGGLNALMDDYVAVRNPSVGGISPTSTTFTLSGLNLTTKYSLYLFGQPSTWEGVPTAFTIKGTTKATSGAGFNGVLTENRDFVKYTLKPNADGTIAGTITAPANYGILNGLQLVEEGFEASVYEANLLTNKPVAFSSEYLPDYAANNAVDGQGGDGGPGNDFVFLPGDQNQRLIVHGFDSSVGLIRVWTGADLAPLSLSIMSSTVDQSDVGAFAGTELVSVPDLANGWMTDTDGRLYRDFAVNTPVGTKSLYFNFGNGNILQGAGAGFARVLEVQAYAVPEPSTVAMLVTGLVGLLVWRKRK